VNTPSDVKPAVDDRVDVVCRGDGHVLQGGERGYIEGMVEGERVRGRLPETATVLFV
jgi:hypothetical protein